MFQTLLFILLLSVAIFIFSGSKQTTTRAPRQTNKDLLNLWLHEVDQWISEGKDLAELRKQIDGAIRYGLKRNEMEQIREKMRSKSLTL